MTRHHGRSHGPAGRPPAATQRPRTIIKADRLRGSGGGRAVMQSGVRFPAAPLMKKSKTYLVAWSVWSHPPVDCPPPLWPSVTRRGLATALHRLRWRPRRPPKAPDYLSLLTGSVARTPQGARIEQDEGGSQCGAPIPVALARAPLSHTQRLPCSQRSVVSATSLTCHTP
jgi:hypothetical protein